MRVISIGFMTLILIILESCGNGSKVESSHSKFQCDYAHFGDCYELVRKGCYSNPFSIKLRLDESSSCRGYGPYSYLSPRSQYLPYHLYRESLRNSGFYFYAMSKLKTRFSLSDSESQEAFTKLNQNTILFSSELQRLFVPLGKFDSE